MPLISLVIVMAANSPKERDYQVKTLEKIIAETEGKITHLGEETDFKNCDFLNMIKGCFIPGTAFRPTGIFSCPLQVMEAFDNCALGLKLDVDLRKKY